MLNPELPSERGHGRETSTWRTFLDPADLMRHAGGRVVTTFSPSPEARDALLEALRGVAEITYLPEVAEGERAKLLAGADAVLGWNIEGELAEEEFTQLKSVRLIQLLSAGVDHVPFHRLPDGVPVASNAGAYAQPMAEHMLGMALALAKCLVRNHAAMARGEFDQQTPNRAIRDSLVGVLGFGGIGQAAATRFRALGARIYAINRSGQTSEPVDQIGTMGDLDAVLSTADVLLLTLPLTRATRRLIGERELSLMKPDAILVNVARAAIIDEDALYEHLRRTQSFSAGLDVWWQEPRHSGAFATRRPFLKLPNVLGSPHNSAVTVGSLTDAARRAAANVARYLRGESAQHLVDRSDYVG